MAVLLVALGILMAHSHRLTDEETEKNEGNRWNGFDVVAPDDGLTESDSWTKIGGTLIRLSAVVGSGALTFIFPCIIAAIPTIIRKVWGTRG